MLELGCGRGVPATRELARRHRVTGVDISAVQIELARHHVPEASFVHADEAELDVATVSLDAIVALFFFGHVPAGEQAPLIAADRLRGCEPGRMAARDVRRGEPGEDVDATGSARRCSSRRWAGEAYGRSLREARLEPLRDEVSSSTSRATARSSSAGCSLTLGDAA